MDSIQKLIEALKELEPDFVSTNQSRAYQGIILTLAKAFPARQSEFQQLLPSAAISRTIKKPVQIKSLSSPNSGTQISGCPTCGKSNSVVTVQQKAFQPNVLKLTKKADPVAESLDNFTEAASAVGITFEEAANALEATIGTGISPEYFEYPEKILTGEPVIESKEWAAVLQEVKDVKQAKELYKAITGKGYPPRWPQDLDQIAKAIWEASNYRVIGLGIVKPIIGNFITRCCCSVYSF